MPGLRKFNIRAFALHFILFGICCLTISSCAFEDTVELNADRESRIVIFSAISPGDSIIVYLNRTSVINSAPTFESDFEGFRVSVQSKSGDGINLSFDSNNRNK